MVTLYLVRHAETESTHPDFERRLTPYGEAQARELGQRLKKHSIYPGQIICSPAVRALTTAQLIGDALQQTIQTYSDIYNASVETLVSILQTFDSIPSVLLVGHNPSLSLLANYLSKTSHDTFAPSELGIIELPIEQWSSLMPHTGTTRELSCGSYF